MMIKCSADTPVREKLRFGSEVGGEETTDATAAKRRKNAGAANERAPKGRKKGCAQ